MLLTQRFAIILVAIALLSISCRRISPMPNTVPIGIDAISPTDDAPTKMRHFAEQAVIDAAQHYKTQLDYTPQSVESIERILDSLAGSPAFRRFTDKDIHAEALIFGAYIGEVIRRERGGQWAEDHQQLGPASYPLSWSGGDSFPYAWCYKRLTNGTEDNVWHKYQLLVAGKPKQ